MKFTLNEYFRENIIELRSEYELDQIRIRSSYPAEVEEYQILQVVKHLSAELRLLHNLSVRTMARLLNCSFLFPYPFFSSQPIYGEVITKLAAELDEYKQLMDKFRSCESRSVYSGSIH